MRRISTILLYGSALAAGGCGSEATPDRSDGAVVRETSEGRYGLIVLTHEAGEAGVSVSGQFIAHSQQTREEALSALALAEQAWFLAAPPTTGTCRFQSSAPVPMTDDGDAIIDLLDAGPIHVQPPNAAPLELVPREFPRLLYAIRGVVYDADAPEALPFGPGGLYRISSAGDEVGPIDGRVRAPRRIAQVWVTAGPEGLEIAWSPAGPVRIALSRERGDRTDGLVCASRDGSRMLVSSGTLASLGEGEAQLTVARVRRSTLRAPGVDDAHVVFLSQFATTVEWPSAATRVVGRGR